MKIVVLDAYAMNSGDLSWGELQQLGETVFYERSSVSEIPERIADAEIILTNKVPLTKENINKVTDLKYIGVMATGYNIVDITEARKRNITVTNVPSYSTASVAQLTFSLILELSTHLSDYVGSVSKGDWVISKDFSYQLRPIIELQNKTLGIIGLGKIGQSVAKIALAFGMKVIASHKHPEQNQIEGVNFVNQEDCFRKSDFVSLHCPLNEQNKNFVNRNLLETMKRSAFLINTSRGGLIHEQDLAQALDTGLIAGAGLDVLSVEPPNPDNPLLKAKNCLITPHIGWATYESRSRLMKTVVNNILAFQKGDKLNVIN